MMCQSSAIKSELCKKIFVVHVRISEKFKYILLVGYLKDVVGVS